MQKSRFLKPITLLSFVLLFISLITAAVNATEEPPLTHNLTALEKPVMAPELKLKDMDEELINLKDLKGKTVVVNFWATWCPPCRREMGSLERLHQATKDKNVEVLAVDIGEDFDTVFSFLGAIDPTPEFKILLNEDGTLMQSWKVLGLPTTFIINPKGEIAYRAVGGREFDHPEIIKIVTGLNKM